MDKDKIISEFQKKIYSKLDETMEEYLSQDDTKGATAFALLLNQKIEAVFMMLETEKLKFKTEEEKLERLKFYHKQIEDMIPKLKIEVAEMKERMDRTPSYIGFMFNELKGGLD